MINGSARTTRAKSARETIVRERIRRTLLITTNTQAAATPPAHPYFLVRDSERCYSCPGEHLFTNNIESFCLYASSRIASQKIYSKWNRCLKLEIYSK